MPYTTKSTNLPSYVKSRSKEVQSKWIAIFNSVYEKDGEEKAFALANSWLKRQVKEKVVAGRTEGTLSRVTFTIDKSQLIKRTDAGEEYIAAVLSDDLPYLVNGQTEQIPVSVLQKWADQINSNLPAIDADHELFESALAKGLSDNQIADILKTKKGIAKAVKAVVDNGKLWIRVLTDKRYRTRIEEAQGLSIEAFVSKDEKGNVYDGNLLGITFAIDNAPANPRTGIMA